jgi:hypothetical protein
VQQRGQAGDQRQVRDQPLRGRRTREQAAQGGVTLRGLTLQRPTPLAAGSATATLGLGPHATYPASRHFVSILLTDGATGDAIGLDYKAQTSGGLRRPREHRPGPAHDPAGTSLPASIRAYAIADVFPLGAALFYEPAGATGFGRESTFWR